MSSSSPFTNPKKVLVLHGRGDDAEDFRDYTEPLRDALGSSCDLVYVEAPHPMEIGGFMWWDASTGNGMQDSVNYIKAVLQNKGPFKGMVGFSQGAGLIARFLSCERDTGISFVVLIAARDPRPVCPTPHSVQTIEVKSLHVYGTADFIVPPAEAEGVSTIFSDPKLVKHSGDHIVPIDGPGLSAIKEFIVGNISE